MDVSLWQIVAVFVIILVSCIFSGMAGGGAAFIILPLLIALGLSPQQAVATSKFSSLGIGIGATAAFKKRAFHNPRLITFLMLLAFVVSLIVPHVFNKLDEGTFRVTLGIIILALIPTVLTRKYGQASQQTSRSKKIVGGGLMAVVLLLSGIFSGGVATLYNLILVSFFGLSTLQANAVKRVTQLTLNGLIVLVKTLPGTRSSPLWFYQV
jgi:uncharacterized membrane protein YfcA